MPDQDTDLSKMLSSATLVLVGTILDSVGRLLERVIIGRALSPGAYGEVNIGLAVLVLGSVIGLLGYSEGITRYTSRFDDEADIRGVWVGSLTIVAVVTVLITAVLLANVDLLARTLFEGEESVMLLTLFVLCIPFRAAFLVGVSAIRGFENTRFRLYVQQVLYPGSRIVLIVGFLAAGYGILAAGYAYLVSVVLAFVVAHVLLSWLFRLVGPFTLHVRKLTRFSLPLVVSSLTLTLLTRTDTLMLGYFRNSFEVGQYSAAYPLANGILLVHGAFGFLFLPVASRLDAEGNRREIDRIFKVTTKWIYVTTFPAFLAFLLFPADVIGIFFGREYTAGSVALAILSVGAFVRAANGRNRQALSALGHTNFILLGTVTAFLFNVAMNLVLIPRYGAAGAALTSALSFVLLNVVITGVLWHFFDISPFSWSELEVYVLLAVSLLPPAFLLSRWIDLTLATLVPFLVLFGLLSLAVVGVSGNLRSDDVLVVEFVEERTGLDIPYVRQFVSEE